MNLPAALKLVPRGEDWKASTDSFVSILIQTLPAAEAKATEKGKRMKEYV